VPLPHTRFLHLEQFRHTLPSFAFHLLIPVRFAGCPHPHHPPHLPTSHYLPHSACPCRLVHPLVAVTPGMDVYLCVSRALPTPVCRAGLLHFLVGSCRTYVSSFHGSVPFRTHSLMYIFYVSCCFYRLDIWVSTFLPVWFDTVVFTHLPFPFSFLPSATVGPSTLLPFLVHPVWTGYVYVYTRTQLWFPSLTQNRWLRPSCALAGLLLHFLAVTAIWFTHTCRR